MPSIEPLVNQSTGTGKGSNSMDNVVSMMDRIANVAERKAHILVDVGYPKIICVHFKKDKYDLPMPVSSHNFDVPLIELVKEVKAPNN